MALQGLLRLGIRTALERSGSELEELVVSVGLGREAADHVRETLMAMPALLVSIDGALARHADSSRLALWRSLLSYLLMDEDLIPTNEGRPVRGILDDAYLLHRAAQEMRRDLPGFELRDLDGGTALLRSALPIGIARELDDRVVRIMQASGPR